MPSVPTETFLNSHLEKHVNRIANFHDAIILRTLRKSTKKQNLRTKDVLFILCAFDVKPTMAGAIPRSLRAQKTVYIPLWPFFYYSSASNVFLQRTFSNLELMHTFLLPHTYKYTFTQPVFSKVYTIYLLTTDLPYFFWP